MERRCSTCAHVYDEREEGDDHPSWRCSAPIPFWVPVNVYDYKSWVVAEDGAKCQTWTLNEAFAHLVETNK